MNSYRATTNNRATTSSGNGWSDQWGRSPALWPSVTNFFRRQPELILGSALVGGALLAYWVKNGAVSALQPAYRMTVRDHQPTASAGAPVANPATGQAWRRHERHRSWVRENEGPWRMPSARLGATEDQMEDLATPSTHALEAGTAGATGAAYDLDPNSITGG